jgi:hypothetical protein
MEMVVFDVSPPWAFDFLQVILSGRKEKPFELNPPMDE